MIEEELTTTDHKMIVMTLCFSQFAQGMGYYRCPNKLLQAKINEEELATTYHKMIGMTIRLNQFAQGMGYYRCPNNLLQDEIFKKVLKTRVEN